MERDLREINSKWIRSDVLHCDWSRICSPVICYSLQWRHNECDDDSNHQPPDCLLNRLGADQGKHQTPASLAFVWGIHRCPVNSPYKGPVTRKMFPFDGVFMYYDAVGRPAVIVMMAYRGGKYCCTDEMDEILVHLTTHHFHSFIASTRVLTQQPMWYHSTRPDITYDVLWTRSMYSNIGHMKISPHPQPPTQWATTHLNSYAYLNTFKSLSCGSTCVVFWKSDDAI